MSPASNHSPLAAPPGTGICQVSGDAGLYRILLVDDNLTFVTSVCNFLKSLAGVTVVGHATNGVQALQKAQVLQPDLVLLDIAMPDIGGLEVAAQMQAWPQVPTLVFLSMNDNDSYREAARLAGANGFVSKTNFVTDLIPMIEQMVTLKTMKVTAP